MLIVPGQSPLIQAWYDFALHFCLAHGVRHFYGPTIAAYGRVFTIDDPIPITIHHDPAENVEAIMVPYFTSECTATALDKA
jgi:hypothetical protein